MAEMPKPQDPDLLIGGRWRAAANGRTCEKLGSYTGHPVSRVAAASSDDARAAADAAADAFPAWSSAPPAECRDILLRAADLLAARAEEIAATVTAETGSTFGWGMFNVMDQVGHEDSKTTLESYARVRKRVSRPQVKRAFEELLARTDVGELGVPVEPREKMSHQTAERSK